MLNPYFRYITFADIYTSPIDLKGNEFAGRIHKEFKAWNPLLANPQVKVNMQEAGKAANAYMKITYSSLG